MASSIRAYALVVVGAGCASASSGGLDAGEVGDAAGLDEEPGLDAGPDADRFSIDELADTYPEVVDTPSARGSL